MSGSKKYPYTVEPNIIKYGKDYYRVIIKKGSGMNQTKFDGYVKGKITDARDLKRQGYVELKKQEHFSKDKGNITFFDFCKLWLDFCRQEKLSPTTISGYKQRLNNYILPTLGGLKLKDINTFTLQQLITNLKNQEKQTLNEKGEIELLSSSSINGAYRVIRNILNRAVDWDYMQFNPLLKVDCPSAKPRKEKESFNKEELFFNLKLLKDYHVKYGAMGILDIVTGMRRCELCGLHIPNENDENIDLDLDTFIVDEKGKKIKCGMIYVNRDAVFDKELKKMVEIPTKTPKSKRGIPIPEFCVDILKDLLDYREKEIMLLKRKYGDDIKIVNNLFLGKSGGIIHPDTLTHNWKKFTRKHNLKNVTLHGLRHSYCSLYRNESNLKDRYVMDLLGHTNIKTTNGYTHSNKDFSGEVLEMWDNIEL